MAAPDALPENPTTADLAHFVRALHLCVEGARTDIRQVKAILSAVALALLTAIVGAGFQAMSNHDKITDQTRDAHIATSAEIMAVGKTQGQILDQLVALRAKVDKSKKK